MKLKLLIVLILVLAAGLGGYFYVNQKPAIQNVIIISMDTTRWDALSCYTAPKGATANIDKFASENVLFENAYSPIPFTLPSHSTMHTGKTPPQHGVLDNTFYVLGEDNLTLAEVLKENSFKTSAFVSTFVLDAKFGLGQGFDHYDADVDEIEGANINQRRGNETTARAMEYLEQNKDERNFVFLHYYDPHSPHDPPEPFKSTYKKAFSDYPEQILLYLAEVSFTDHCIGQFFNKLKELDIYDNSLIFVVGDHGEGLGEHEELTHGFFIYNSTTKVPMIIKVPGVEQPLRVKDPVGLVDMTPTICSFLGIDFKEKIQGFDISDLIRGKKNSNPGRNIFSLSLMAKKYGGNSLFGIISGDYKYIQTTRPELYNIATDAYEATNLIEKESHRARIMQEELRAILDDVPVGDDTGQMELDAATIAKLESLGYVGAKGVVESFDFDTEAEDPKDLVRFDTFYNGAQAALLSKDFEMAKKGCREMIKLRPDIAMGHFVMSKTLIMNGEVDEALPFLETVVKLDPEDEKAFTGLAFIYGKRGDYDAAIEACINAIKAKSSFSAAYYELANNYFKKGIYDLPVEHLTEDIKNSSNYPETLVMIADLLLQHKQIKRGYDLYLESLALQGESVNTLNGLAWMSATSSIQGVRDTAAAVKYAQKACELTDHKTAKYLDTLAAALAANGQMDKAVQTAKKAVELAKSDEDEGFTKRITSRLELYKNGKSYLDPSLK